MTTRQEAEDGVRALLRFIGEDPEREGLRDTPARVVRAWEQDWGNGYKHFPELRSFTDGAELYNQMVVECRIPVWSHCEHHLAPFFGHAAIGYIPRAPFAGRPAIIGLSKLVRIVNHYAHRLQVQERLTQEIATALTEAIPTEGVGVVLECRHTCMESRGVRTTGVLTTTSALRGSFLEDRSVRNEFFSIVQRST